MSSINVTKNTVANVNWKQQPTAIVPRKPLTCNEKTACALDMFESCLIHKLIIIPKESRKATTLTKHML